MVIYEYLRQFDCLPDRRDSVGIGLDFVLQHATNILDHAVHSEKQTAPLGATTY